MAPATVAITGLAICGRQLPAAAAGPHANPLQSGFVFEFVQGDRPHGILVEGETLSLAHALNSCALNQFRTLCRTTVGVAA